MTEFSDVILYAERGRAAGRRAVRLVRLLGRRFATLLFFRRRRLRKY